MEIEIYNPEESFQQFYFQGMHIKEACWIDGVPHVTRRAIGEFLEYPRPNQAIKNIITRNPHIDDPRWSSVLKLSTELDTGSGTKYEREVETRVYNPIGLQLIIFESRQPKAKAYKIIVANLVWAYSQGQLTAPDNKMRLNLKNIALLPRYSHGRAEAIRQLAKELNKSTDTARRYIVRFENNKPLDGRSARDPETYIWPHNREKRAKALRLKTQLPGMKIKDIAREVEAPEKTVYRWLGPTKSQRR